MKIFQISFLLITILFVQSCNGEEDTIKKKDEVEESKDDFPSEGAVKVEVIEENGIARIYRNGKPYYIKGAAYNNFISEVPKYGGNSIRTYGVSDETMAVLDSALANKITVCLGIWINRETDGYDYDDEEAWAEQKERIRQEVLQFIDHPAVLMWGIGNEVDSRYTNYKVWNFIGEISDMIHELDPNHPTTTVLAGADPTDVEEIIVRAPSLDILSINSYNAIATVQEKIYGAGWTDKPYLVTEWGPRGTWDNNNSTSWGGLYELTSTEKGEVYRNVYSDHIAANYSNNCGGSYVFLWGYQTHGAVATWYGLFTRKKKPLEAAHAMHYNWKGSFPVNRAPRIESSDDITLNGKKAEENIILSVGIKNTASVKALDLEGDQLTYDWQIVPEGIVIDKEDSSGGALPGLDVFVDNSTKTAEFTMQKRGEYRLYAFVYDTEGNAASAVIPFKVN